MEQFFYILGQALGVVAVILGFVSFQMKTSKGILCCQIATASLFSAHYLLINAITAMALNIIAAVMCVFYYFRNKRGGKSLFEPTFFTLLVIITSVFTWDGWYSVFISAGLVLNAIALSLSDPQKTRTVMLVKSPLCLIYNIIVISVGGSVYESVALISSIIGLIKYRNKNNSLTDDGIKFEAAIFDMDGTLVDSLMLWDILWKEFGTRYLNNPQFVPEKEDDKAVRTLTLKDAMILIHDRYNIGTDGEELLNVANSIMTDFYTNSVKLKSGVRDFLEYLYNNNIKMCIASATAPDLIKLAIEHCKLDKYFSEIFSCGEIGKGKEHPDIFLMVQEYLGEEIEDICVFEDSLVAIETASKVGMKTVGIYDKYNFGQDKIKRIADEYIAEGETLLKIL